MKHRIFKKTIALLLAICLLPVVRPIHAVTEEDSPLSPATEVQTQSTIEPAIKKDTSNSTEVFSALVEGTQILSHINEDVFRENKHVARLTQEEDLNNYIFLNSDGSQTVYYMDEEVKFIDANGTVREKDLSLSDVRDGYTTTRNDVGLTLPTKPGSGIRLSYSGYDITLTPVGGSDLVVARQSGNSVTYPDYFGTGMSLVYTPTLSGVKEDILLDRYRGVTDFTFLLETDGLGLYQSNGKYYLAAAENAEMRIDLGEVVAYDSAGHFNLGSMTVTTVTANQQYRLTLHANEDFLQDATTVYPVWIDPTLSVSDNTHGINAIQDITLYSGRPNANCNWQYLACGYYDSTYQRGRTLVRLSGLTSSSTFTSISHHQITSVKFYIKEATGSATRQINLYHNFSSGDWVETTATWNSIFQYVSDDNFNSDTLYATANAVSNTYTEFDITQLVKNWKTWVHSPDKGFILKVDDETAPHKAFCSSEYSNSSDRPYVVMNYSTTGVGGGDSLASAAAITAGSSATVYLADATEKRYFKFTPAETGFYTIESSNNTYDPYLWVYNPNQAYLDEVDDINGISSNFRYTGHFMGGYTYYFVVGSFGSDFGECTVSVSSTYSLPSEDVLDATTTNAYTFTIPTGFNTVSYRFVPTETRQYVIQSGNDNGDPRVWLYNSSLDYITSNDDGGSGLNFRLTATLTAGETYYIIVGDCVDNVETYGFNILMPVNPDVSNEEAYLIKNTGTKKFVDIHDPATQELVHQWSFNADADSRWKISQQSDGYYTFQSTYGNMYYIGISSTDANTDNISLFSAISDATRWRIYETDDGNLLFEPINAPGKLLYAPNSTDGTELQLCWVSQTSDKCVWDIAYSDAFLDFHVPNRTLSIQCIGEDAITEPWYSIIEGAVLAWNNSGARTNISLVTDYSDYTCEIVYRPYAEWSGRAVCYPSNTSTTSAAIEINSAKYYTSFEQPYRNERMGTVVHEIGHLLGLKDEPLLTNPNASIMNYERNRSSIFVPQLFDIENVKFLYS